VIRRARHLRERQMFDCYLAARGGEPLDPPVAEHLTDCTPCGSRYADLARFMDALGTEAAAETDAMFPPERLQAQQREIARRIESVGRPARVINFPGQVMRGATAMSSSRAAPRWAAAAAAAGLFVGIALGASYEWESRGAAIRQATARETNESRTARLIPAAATRSSLSTDGAADDEFLSELELALDRPRTRELLAFDAFTPHVREIRDLR
jgi:hypothetical protein